MVTENNYHGKQRYTRVFYKKFDLDKNFVEIAIDNNIKLHESIRYGIDERIEDINSNFDKDDYLVVNVITGELYGFKIIKMFHNLPYHQLIELGTLNHFLGNQSHG